MGFDDKARGHLPKVILPDAIVTLYFEAAKWGLDAGEVRWALGYAEHTVRMDDTGDGVIGIKEVLAGVAALREEKDRRQAESDEAVGAWQARMYEEQYNRNRLEQAAAAYQAELDAHRG